MNTKKFKLIIKLLKMNVPNYKEINIINVTDVCTIKITFNDKIALLNLDKKELSKIAIEKIEEEFNKEHTYDAIIDNPQSKVSIFKKDSFLLDIFHKSIILNRNE